MEQDEENEVDEERLSSEIASVFTEIVYYHEGDSLYLVSVVGSTAKILHFLSIDDAINCFTFSKKFSVDNASLNPTKPTA